MQCWCTEKFSWLHLWCLILCCLYAITFPLVKSYFWQYVKQNIELVVDVHPNGRWGLFVKTKRSYEGKLQDALYIWSAAKANHLLLGLRHHFRPIASKNLLQVPWENKWETTIDDENNCRMQPQQTVYCSYGLYNDAKRSEKDFKLFS